MAGTDKLALEGGTPAVTIKAAEQWTAPVEEEKKAVCEVIDQRFLSGSGTGMPKEFEEECRERIGCKHFVACDHGSNALAAACYAAGLGPGDEFITPAAGYIGTYCGALHMGATPVFCEVDPHTLLMDPADAERRVTERTRVLIPIHACGRPADMDALLAIAEKHSLVVVEDAAHALGSTWDGKAIGNVGHIACFSFQGTTPGGKPLGAGEGGAVATNDRELYERHLAYCHLHRSGITDELTLEPYCHLDSEVLGYKWRAHPLAIALARVALRSLDYRIRRVAESRDRLFAGLDAVPGFEPVRNYPKATGSEVYGGLRIVYHPDQLDGLPPGKCVEALRAEGVPMGGIGLFHREHLRWIYASQFELWGRGRGRLPHYKLGDYPLTEELHGRVLSFPAYIDPPDGLIAQCIEAFAKVARHAGELV